MLLTAGKRCRSMQAREAEPDKQKSGGDCPARQSPGSIVYDHKISQKTLRNDGQREEATLK